MIRIGNKSLRCCFITSWPLDLDPSHIKCSQSLGVTSREEWEGVASIVTMIQYLQLLLFMFIVVVGCITAAPILRSGWCYLKLTEDTWRIWKLDRNAARLIFHQTKRVIEKKHTQLCSDKSWDKEDERSCHRKIETEKYPPNIKGKKRRNGEVAPLPPPWSHPLPPAEGQNNRRQWEDRNIFLTAIFAWEDQLY